MNLEISPAEKLRILSAIHDEVKEFHPLLHQLLVKLPRIVSVDYTHGPSEKGADLIVTRKEDATGKEETIAVIAKVGKIGKNINSIGIADQIEDCFIGRHSINGKRL